MIKMKHVEPILFLPQVHWAFMMFPFAVLVHDGLTAAMIALSIFVVRLAVDGCLSLCKGVLSETTVLPMLLVFSSFWTTILFLLVKAFLPSFSTQFPLLYLGILPVSLSLLSSLLVYDKEYGVSVNKTFTFNILQLLSSMVCFVILGAIFELLEKGSFFHLKLGGFSGIITIKPWFVFLAVGIVMFFLTDFFQLFKSKKS